MQAKTPSYRSISPAYIAISILISLLFHLLLIEGTGNLRITMPGMRDTRDIYDEPMLIELLPEPPAPRNLQDFPTPRLREDDTDISKAATEALDHQDLQKPDIHESIERLFEEVHLVEQPRDDYRLNGIQKDFEAERLPLVSPIGPEESQELMATAPRPEIIEIEYKDLAADRQELPGRIIRPFMERVDVPDFDLPSMAAHGNAITVPQGNAIDMQLKSARPSFGKPDFSIDPLPIDTGKDPSQFALPQQRLNDMERVNLDLGDDNGDLPVAFDSFVNVKVLVFRDQNGPGGYFEIDISPNASSDALRDIPKDVLFIIDRSTSIARPKFEQFKQATIEAIGHLSRNDRFNVVSFNEKSQPIFKELTPVTGKSIQEAEKAINSMLYGGKTDVFGGIAPYVRRGNGNLDRPFNIFLLTDGQSTVNIFKSSDFLRQIVSINPGNVSIYPFSAGNDANRQLLDYLGYLNRGGKFHVDELKEIRNRLVTFITSHSNLVIMDLKFTTNAQFGREIYPKTLPHLYRGETLKLFGRFEDIHDEIVLSLQGRDADLKSRDFVLRRKLSSCEQGNETLPYEWAVQKILWLSAWKNCSDNPTEIKRLDAEISALRNRYRVYLLE